MQVEVKTLDLGPPEDRPWMPPEPVGADPTAPGDAAPAQTPTPTPAPTGLDLPPLPESADLPPPGPPTADECLWAAVAHLSLVALGIVAPVVILMTKGKDSEFVTDQALEALNFQVTAFIVVIVTAAVVEEIIGSAVAYAVVTLLVIAALVAAGAAYRGKPYRYPIALRVVQ